MPTVHLIQNTNKTVTVVRLLVIALHVCTTVIVLLLVPQIYSKISVTEYTYMYLNLWIISRYFFPKITGLVL